MPYFNTSRWTTYDFYRNLDGGYLQNRRRFAAELEALYDRRFWHGLGPEEAPSLGAQLLDSRVSVLEPHLRDHFPTSVEDLGDAVVRWTPPLLRYVVDQLAGHYSAVAECELYVKTSGRTARRAEWPFVGEWDAIWGSDELQAGLEASHTMSELQGSSFPWSRIIDGQVLLDPLAPYALDAAAHELVPRALEKATQIIVPAAGNAPVDNPDGFLRVMWERKADGTLRAGYVDEEGRAVDRDLPEAPGGRSRLQQFPIVAWHSRRPAGLFAQPDWSLYDEQIAIAVFAVWCGMAFQLGATGQWWTDGEIEGAEQQGQDAVQSAWGVGDQSGPRQIIRAGMQNIMRLRPAGAKLNLAQAQADVAAMLGSLVKMMQVAAMTRGVSARRFDTEREGSNNSGRHALVAEEPLLSLVEKAEKQLKRNTVRTLEAWRAVHNLLYPRGDAKHIPEELGFRPRFEDLPSPIWDQSAAQGRQIEYEAGVEDPIRDVQLRMGIPAEEAYAEVMRRRERIARWRAQMTAAEQTAQPPAAEAAAAAGA